MLLNRNPHCDQLSAHPAMGHTPVLVKEAIALLQVRPGGRYVDATVGGGGHAAAIMAAAAPEGRLLGLDADPEALDAARRRLFSFGEAVTLIQANFVQLEEICATYDFRPVDGLLFDLGMSSLQLIAGRGFSFYEEALLDMRYDRSQELTADYIVNHYSEVELARVLEKFGEERHSRRIARRIRENRPITTALELARVVETVVQRRGRLHPATRTFMALRIAVNNELDNLALALKQTLALLRPGGRLAVISYHSLEDRLVKDFMARESRGCLCHPRTPVCLCGHTPVLSLVNRRIIAPSAEEVKSNPRSRSARMRVAEKLWPK